MQISWPSLLLLLPFLLLRCCRAFNVGTNRNMTVLHRGTKNTLFGYKVAMFKNGPDEYSLLVGAPRANSGQPNVVRGGAVYKCSSVSSRCSVQYFDRKGDTEALDGHVSRKIGSKSDQWFGATIITLDTDDESKSAVVACAPHYLYFGSKFDIREPIGNCFYANKSFQNIREFSPCKVKHKHGFHRLGFCMAGFSGSLSKDNAVYLGEPGAYYWGGAVGKQSTNFARRPMHTSNGSKEYDDQFMGYSTATGDFNGDHIDDVALGVPRGNHLMGKVVLLTDRFVHILNLTGDQMGSYFGAAIAVTDLNNDGLHDIIVGAPLYTNVEESSAGVKSVYEIGRVYVYLQTRDHKFDKIPPISGQKEWSKFGYDVAAAGDLNQDGYNDFIVGAPFDGLEKKSGAVYIFNGAKGGVHEKFSQVIYGQSIQSSIESFGFSVSGGRDVDNNGYPDILVGAYKSDSVILFKSRPVINIEGSIRITPSIINLSEKTCRILSGGAKDEKVACVKVNVCAKYSGKKVSPDLDLKFIVILDATNKKTPPRAKFLSRGGSMSSMTVETTMFNDETFCSNTEVYVEEGIRDKLTPIMIHVNFSVMDELYRRDALVPVVSILDGGFLKEELKIHRDCGRDEKCIPDLQMVYAGFSKANIAAGADERFNLTMNIRNRLEPAYESYLYVYTPKGMDLESAVEVKNKPFTCDRQVSSDEIKGYDVVKCDLGNPMPGNRAAYDVALTFATKFFEGPYENVPMIAKVNSTNNESADAMFDNTKNITMSFALDADLEVYAGNNSYVYDVEGFKDPATFQWDEDIGPLVNHTYELVNTRNSTLTEVLLDIYFPSSTHDGQPLLYIIGNITLDDNHDQTTCTLFQKGNINPNHYAISKFVKRVKRQVEDRTKIIQEQPQSFLNLLSLLRDKTGYSRLRGYISENKFNCFDMNCTHWRCSVKNFRKGFRLKITVEARLWTNTMIKEGFYGATISSVIIAQVAKLSYKAPGGLDLPIKHAVATTTVTASDPNKLRRGLPWWIILIAVLAGLALLILLTLLLWRCGFFKRKRPPRGQALLAKPNEPEYYGYSTYSAANPNYPAHGAVPYGQRL